MASGLQLLAERRWPSFSSDRLSTRGPHHPTVTACNRKCMATTRTSNRTTITIMSMPSWMPIVTLRQSVVA